MLKCVCCNTRLHVKNAAEDDQKNTFQHDGASEKIWPKKSCSRRFTHEFGQLLLTGTVLHVHMILILVLIFLVINRSWMRHRMKYGIFGQLLVDVKNLISVSLRMCYRLTPCPFLFQCALTVSFFRSQVFFTLSYTTIYYIDMVSESIFQSQITGKIAFHMAKMQQMLARQIYKSSSTLDLLLRCQ